jgi:seryl-tRNA synthetase
MTSRDGRHRTNLELPVETLEALREEKDRTGQPLWELVDQGARMIVQVDDSTEKALQRRLEDVRDDKERVQDEITQRQQELERLKEKEADVEQKLTELREEQDTIEELYTEIVATLQNNPKRNIYSCKATLDKIATREYGRPTESNVEAVITDIREYCEDNDIDIADHRVGTSNTAFAQPQTSDGGEPFLRSVDGADD